MFQFYDSPIKRHDKESILSLFGCFNSMIVRLKEGDDAMKLIPHKFQFYDSPIKSLSIVGHKREYFRFQFYDSPIKSAAFQEDILATYSFNSMIVRLKACTGSPKNSLSHGFNSMIVRLKVVFTPKSLSSLLFVSIL